MHEIICPHCGKAFKIDEAGYADILKQVRDRDFEQQLHERLELAEQDKRNEVELAKTKLTHELQTSAAAKDAEIQELKARLDGAETSRKLAVTEALGALEKERDRQTCVTLGMRQDGQAEELKQAGLDYYNHNIDTAPEFYGQVISTHTQADRFDTLNKVRQAGLNLCCGGIVGMGESRRERAALIAQLANMNPAPESVPINHLVLIPGTPLDKAPPLDPFEFVRTIACARITMPTSMVRLSAGREHMSDELQSLCFLAGANSIFYGDKLLTADNAEAGRDEALFARLGLNTN